MICVWALRMLLQLPVAKALFLFLQKRPLVCVDLGTIRSCVAGFIAPHGKSLSARMFSPQHSGRFALYRVIGVVLIPTCFCRAATLLLLYRVRHIYILLQATHLAAEPRDFSRRRALQAAVNATSAFP